VINIVIFLLASTSILSTAAYAQSENCHTKIRGKVIQLKFNPEDNQYLDNTTFREILFSNWDDSCPSYIVLKHMTPKLNPVQRETFCAEYENDKQGYAGISLGERDAYGKCKKPGQICKVVNASKDEALAIVGIGAGAAGGASLATSVVGVTAVTHSSGAVILTGSAGYLAGTLGTAAATVVATLTAPATLIGAAVSIVTVGGAVYICKQPHE